jgi:hypothetical protein
LKEKPKSSNDERQSFATTRLALEETIGHRCPINFSFNHASITTLTSTSHRNFKKLFKICITCGFVSIYFYNFYLLISLFNFLLKFSLCWSDVCERDCIVDHSVPFGSCFKLFYGDFLLRPFYARFIFVLVSIIIYYLNSRFDI